MDQMYDIVADVSKYNEFVPWCKLSSCDPPKKSGKHYKCHLTVGFGPIVEKYTSIVTVSRPHLVRVSWGFWYLSFFFLLLQSREYRNISISPSICPRVCLHDTWLDFLHVWYHDQVQWAVDACKIELGCMTNFSNCVHFFIHFECLLWYTWRVCWFCSYLVH